MTKNSLCDVLIIGAGPSGAVTAAILVQKGYQVTMLESTAFPRFSIGESLLPQAQGASGLMIDFVYPYTKSNRLSSAV